MSIIPQPPIQSARDLVFSYLSSATSGISLYADDGATQLPVGDIVLNEAFPYTDGLLTVAKDPFPHEKVGPSPKVVVGQTTSGPAIPITLPPIWYEIDDVVPVRVVVRDWLGNDLGFNLSGDVARRNLLNSVKSIINANQYSPDPAGVWNWMRIIDPGQDMDELTGGAQPLYITQMKVGLKRFTLTV